VANIIDVEKELVAEGLHEHDGFTQALPGAGLWKVHPTGCRLGDAAKGPIMRWRLQRDGIVFGLTKRAEPHKTNPSGFVRMTGDVLLALGSAEALWRRVVEWFAELGATVVEAKLSRVDMCVDLPGVGVDEFMAAFREGRYVTRTKKSEEWSFATYRAGRQDTGLAMGTVTRVRIYDKSEECRDIACRAWMVHRRWGGVDPDKATRVEFQLRREFLTEHGVSTVEDYFAKRRALARFLCGSWIKFVADGFDERHTDRAITLPLWKRVAEDFDTWTTGAPVADLSPIARETVKPESLVKQIRGCAERVAALQGVKIEGPDDFLGFVNEHLYALIEDDTEIGARVRNKTSTIAAPLAACT